MTTTFDAPPVDPTGAAAAALGATSGAAALPTPLYYPDPRKTCHRPDHCTWCQHSRGKRRCDCDFPHQPAPEDSVCLYCACEGTTLWSYFEDTGRRWRVRFLCTRCCGMWTPESSPFELPSP
eukprot:PhM_4_TR8046/c1_g3_i1/m.106594